MDIKKLFSIPFVVDTLNEIDNAKVKEYCNKLKVTQNGTVYSNVGGWHSPIITGYVSELNELFYAILKRLRELHKEVGVHESLEQQIAHAWVTINKRGDYNQEHFHAGWFFSAVYYVEAPEDCGDFVAKYASEEIRIKPEEGKLLIFPSFVLHSVEPSNSDQDRISIALDSKIIKKAL
jgi:hypothetical protein